MKSEGAKRHLWRTGLAATLLLSCSPMALHAETSNAELASQIAELKAQIRALRGAISETRVETRRTAARVATKAPYVLPPPAYAIPEGATPAFVTQDKKFQYGSLTITPGGFIAAESVFRSKNLQADMISPFNNVPFPNNAVGHTNEFRPSARQTRLAALVESPITSNYFASGYVEFDFLGAASTANENQTNSYTPRIRNLYATLDDKENGFHVLAGQNWSLVTLNSKGITPRNEVTPSVIDAQQTVGSLYARQAQIRITKDFDKKLWFALSVEESQSSIGGCPTNLAAGGGVVNPGQVVLANGSIVTCNAVGAGGAFVGANQAGPSYSLNHLPDVIGKVAYEARLADRDVHLEATGMYTDLYDRVLLPNGTGVNKDTTGYGVGAGLIVPILPKKLDFQINGMYGRGINRYGAAGLSESIVNGGDGSLKPVQGYVALAGLTLHATSALDIYGYGGIEGVARTYTANGAGFTGIGTPTTDIGGCLSEAGNGQACANQTRQIWQINAGFWDKLYKGSFGEVRVGAQYSYTKREIFNSSNPAAAAATLPFANLKADEHMVFTSLRYFPFAADAPKVPVVAKY